MDVRNGDEYDLDEPLATNLLFNGATGSNIYLSGGISAASSSIASFSFGTATGTNLSFTNATATNLYVSGLIQFGTIYPLGLVNNTYDLGSASASWRNVYASGTGSTFFGITWTYATGTNTTSTNEYANRLLFNGATGSNLNLTSGLVASTGTINTFNFGFATGSQFGFVNATGTTLSAAIITVSSLLAPAGNNLYDIGSASTSWRNIYASGTGSFFSGINWTSATGTNTTSTNLYATNLLFNGATGSNINVTGITATTGTINTIGFVNATGSNLYVSGLIQTGTIMPIANNTYNLGSASTAWANVYASGTGSAFFGITWTYATGTNTTSTNLYATNLLFNGATGSNIYLTGGISAASSSIASFSFGTATGTNLSFTNATATNLYVSGLIQFGTIYPLGLVNNLYDIGSGSSSWRNVYASGTISFNGATGSNISVTGITATSGTVSTLGFTNATGTVFFVTTGIFGTLCIGADCRTSWPSGGFIPQLTQIINAGSSATSTPSFDMGFTATTGVITNTTSTNLYASNLLFSGATGSSLYVSGSIGQAGGTSINNYLKTNSGNLASTSNLNPGVLVYGNSGLATYGMDLGYNATSSRYRNRMFFYGTAADFAFSYTNAIPTTQQSDFRDLVIIRGDTGYMGIGTEAPTERLSVHGNVAPTVNNLWNLEPHLSPGRTSTPRARSPLARPLGRTSTSRTRSGPHRPRSTRWASSMRQVPHSTPTF